MTDTKLKIKAVKLIYENNVEVLIDNMEIDDTQDRLTLTFNKYALDTSLNNGKELREYIERQGTDDTMILGVSHAHTPTNTPHNTAKPVIQPLEDTDSVCGTTTEWCR